MKENKKLRIRCTEVRVECTYSQIRNSAWTKFPVAYSYFGTWYCALAGEQTRYVYYVPYVMLEVSASAFLGTNHLDLVGGNFRSIMTVKRLNSSPKKSI